MEKIFRVIGGRKFLLTVVSMLGASAIDLLIPQGLSVALAGFLGTALTAFCASNWLNSREYHKADAEKKKGGSADISRIEAKLTKIAKTLDNPEGSEYYRSQLEQMNSALGEMIQAQANIMQTTKATHNTIVAAMNVGGKG